MRVRVWVRRVSPPKKEQNCFGLWSPAILSVKLCKRVPSPPARTTGQRCPTVLSEGKTAGEFSRAGGTPLLVSIKLEDMVLLLVREGSRILSNWPAQAKA